MRFRNDYSKADREIKVSHGMRKKMMALFDTTYPTLRSALHFKVSNEKAVMMRQYALKHGGVLMESAVGVL